jgi:hypothetical protein
MLLCLRQLSKLNNTTLRNRNHNTLLSIINNKADITEVISSTVLLVAAMEAVRGVLTSISVG